VPVLRRENRPGGAFAATWMIAENVPFDEATVSVGDPAPMLAGSTALICVGET
jgi:hypothetical protein